MPMVELRFWLFVFLVLLLLAIIGQYIADHRRGYTVPIFKDVFGGLGAVVGGGIGFHIVLGNLYLLGFTWIVLLMLLGLSVLMIYTGIRQLQHKPVFHRGQFEI